MLAVPLGKSGRPCTLLLFEEQVTHQPRHPDRCLRLRERRGLEVVLCQVQCAEEDSYSRGKLSNIHQIKHVNCFRLYFDISSYDIHVTEPMIGMWTDIDQEAETRSESVKVVGKVGQLV